EDLIQLFCLVAGRSDDFSLLEFKPDPIESGSLVNAWRIKRDVSLNGVFHRATENFAIGNIAIAAADHRWNSLDTETQIGAGTFDLDTVCLLHQPLERLHAGLQFAIVQRAHIEVEVFECLRAHPGKLCHGGSGPA